MTIATEYSANWIQTSRPQPMYNKVINKLLGEVYCLNPANNHNLANEFKIKFLEKLNNLSLNHYTGLDKFKHYDVIIGCTQFIDDLYIRLGNNLITLENDYAYHKRLNPKIQYGSLDNLVTGTELLISLPFPFYGDIHPNMDMILTECYKKNIPVHIDGAWITCSRDIVFNFSHPAIVSLGISLSKGLGLGGNRIGLRLSKVRPTGAITLMNDFNMNCQGLMQTGLHFLNKLPLEYFWLNYEQEYNQVCADFKLSKTKAIHLAKDQFNRPVGIRPLLRFLKNI